MSDKGQQSRHRQRSAAIDGWLSLHPNHLPPSDIPAEHITSAQAVSSPALLPRSGPGVSNPTAEGDLYIFGGRSFDTYLNDLWFYSLKENTATLFQCHGDLPSPRMYPSISVTGDVLILWGGSDSEEYDDALYQLDLVSRKWTKVELHDKVPAGRDGHASVTIGSKLFMFGGYTKSGSQRVNDIWSFDIDLLQSRPTWKFIEPSSHVHPPPRNGHQLFPYQNQLITFGGCGSYSYNDVWSFDLETSKWTEIQYTGQTPLGGQFYAGAIINDMIYVQGGWRGGTFGGDLAVFNISSRRWFRFKNSGPRPRSSHCMVSAGSLIYVFGGWTNIRGIYDLDITYVLDTGPSLPIPGVTVKHLSRRYNKTTESIEELSPRRLNELVKTETEEKRNWRKMWEKQEEKRREKETEASEELME